MRNVMSAFLEGKCLVFFLCFFGVVMWFLKLSLNLRLSLLTFNLGKSIF
jgi:hypothetical protein